MPTRTAPEPMTAKQVLRELESLGTEQTRKTNRRHGITGGQFGVSYANFYALQKRLKANHPLAIELWDSKNYDARILATLIVEPGKIDMKLAKAWSSAIDCIALALAVAGPFSKSPAAGQIADAWRDDKNEFRGAISWSILGRLAMSEDATPDKHFEELLKAIESNVHASKNWVRYSMVGALIAIGARNEKLKAKALAAAKRIGTVDVDHGDTSCKTPNPLTAIEKSYAHRHRKAKTT
jgi:3-methyladenine DNA glycosylase AlkD